MGGASKREVRLMANAFKKIIDRNMWVQSYPSPNAHAAGASLACDLRNDVSRNPFIYHLVSSTVLNRHNAITKGWNFVVSPALAGTFGAGAASIFAPSCALMGNIGAGCTTTKIVTTTSITAVGVNMLANRGGSGDYGFRIRIKGNSAGSSGKVEERWCVANTGGTTPTIWLDSALSFTPANGDTYEILGGRLFMLGAGTTAAGTWRSIETVTNGLASLGTTNLPASIATDSSLCALDEQYVPYDHKPGEGFVTGSGTYDSGGIVKSCLIATAIAAGTITGQASAGDYAVAANEYRNFQIRIVEDTGTPTAVGQRRIIASHTAGASPVYTLGSNWAVTPSANCKYVIEYPNLIIGRSSATTTVYTYNYSGATINNGTNSINSDTWSTAYFGAAGSNNGAGGMWFPSFGIEPDVGKNARHSFTYFFRGGASAAVDLLDIAGGATGAWTAGIVIDGAVSLTTGSCGKIAPGDQEGKFGYLNIYTASATNQMYRFDVKNRVLTPFTPTDWIQSGTAAVGERMAVITAIDGTDKYSVIYSLAHLSTIFHECVVLE